MPFSRIDKVKINLQEERSNMLVREFHPGMGQAVAERTVLRRDENGKFETWGDVAHRVALGNSLLGIESERESEYQILNKHISKVTVLMSGRHLQHGDESQPSRTMEVFTNCSSSSSSFLMFYLLMSGSGVGRCYDDDMMLIDWDNAPNLRCVIDHTHPDYDYMAHESVRDAKHKYGSGRDVMWFKVPDSREGWAKAVEIYENAAFEKIHRDKTLILDFSDVRPSGTPIKGMQGRPASGPVPLMNAFIKASSLKGAGLDPWRQAMYLDHYFAECVLVGGARRSARMSVKCWRDKNIIDFIQVKRPIEYLGKSVEEIVELRKIASPMGFLWSSNNSILVDEEFWELLDINPQDCEDPEIAALCKHAHHVFDITTSAAYADGTGEPGFINQDKLVQNNEGLNDLLKGDFVGSSKYQVEDDTHLYLRRLAKKAKKKKFYTIVNPCSEIAFNVLGAFCVIADVVPYFADTLDEAEDAFRAAVRSLIRVNTMDSIYAKEVKRTNRIGVAITGIHEFAWKFFGLNFYDLIDEEKSKDFWMTMSRFARAVEDEAVKYCKIHNLPVPHTLRTIKPSGTVSKLWGLTEGWHLPSMAWYLRWVQFSENDPLVGVYTKAGYPTRKLTSYKGTVIVGFPTEPVISKLMPADKLVVAGQATPEEQYKWLMMGEKYWIECVDENEKPLPHRGNQISYTLKYDPKKVGYALFRETIKNYQSKVRCCAMMPQEDTSAYEYTPEEAITRDRFHEIVENLTKSNVVEDIGKEHIDCANGACPVDFNASK
jgi:adenosylcobalamin-dependent ribonucleoside-triphosphate reductase